MIVRSRIERKLIEGLSPVELVIEDFSNRHQGHAGSRPEGESHFSVKIVAESFRGKSSLDRQRMVYALLAEEMGKDIHALTLVTLAPGEESRN